MTDVDIPLLPIAIAAIILLSALALPIVPTGGPSNDTSGTIQTPNPVTSEPTDTDVDAPTPANAELYGVPDSHTQTATSGLEEPEVHASTGSQTMSVRATSAGDEPAIVLEDTDTHDGRWVSISTEWFRSEVGSVPAYVTIEHSSGETYNAKTFARSGGTAFYVEEFSTNTVTFSGTTSISASPATDGSTLQYELSSTDSASNPTVNLTGNTNTDWANQSGSSSPKISKNLQLAGNRFTDGQGNDPKLTVTAELNADANPATTLGDGSFETGLGIVGDNKNDNEANGQITFTPQKSGKIQSLKPYIDDVRGSDYGVSVDIYIYKGTAGDSITKGELVGTWDPDFNTGRQTISVDPYQVTANETYTISFNTQSTDSDGETDLIYVRTDDSASSVYAASVYSTSTNLKEEYADADILITSDANNVEVTDGTGTSITLGDFTEGETKTARVDLSQDSDYLNITGSGVGTLNYALTVQEQTQTVDPSVELNGQTVSHSGTLADGETVSKSFDNATLEEGTNTINVSVGDGSLSSDAPAPVVDLNYTHDSADDIATDYTAGKWIESYNVSKTYADDGTNATLTIPFESDVYAIRDVETRSNGSAWTGTSDYELDNTTLTVQLGDVSSGEEVAVRTTGYRVQPVNASITVTDATTDGELDSRIRVDSWQSIDDSYLSIGGTENGERLHYVHDASYSEDHHLEVTSNGNHRLYLPNAAANDEFNVSTVPYRATAKSGEVEYTITDTTETNLTLDVAPGETTDDEVEFTYLNATDGKTYVLYSESDAVARDQQTATSPVTLTDDDSAEVLSIFVDDDAGGAADSSSGGGGGPIAPTATGDPQFIPLAGVALALGLLAVVARRNEAVAAAGSDTAETVSGAVPVVGPIVGGLVRTLSQTVAALFASRIVAVLLGGAITVGAVQGGIIRLGPSTEALAAIAIVGIGSLVALQEIGEFTARRWVALLATTTIISLQLLGTGDIITAVTESQAFPIVVIALAVGALWLIQGVRQGFSTPDQVTEVVVDGDWRDGD